MSAIPCKVGETIRTYFYVFDTDGYTPLTGKAGNCSAVVVENGAVNGAISPSLNEVGSTGQYYAEWAFANPGDGSIKITCTDNVDLIWGAEYLVLTYDIDDVAAKTNNLPSDPADQSLVEAAINTSAFNIRGVDFDTLKILSDQLDTAQADLDNPDQYKADVSALSTSVELAAHDAKLDIVDGVVDAVKLKTDNLPADPASEGNVDDVAGEVDTELSSSHGAGSWEGATPPTVGEIADAVWDEARAGHVTIGSMGYVMKILYAIETGRWKLDKDACTLTFYDEDAVTPLLVFDTLDESGDPDAESVYERSPE